MGHKVTFETPEGFLDSEVPNSLAGAICRAVFPDQYLEEVGSQGIEGSEWNQAVFGWAKENELSEEQVAGFLVPNEFLGFLGDP